MDTLAINNDITHEEQLEGGNTLTNNPADAGGRTIYGISERANPDLWVNGPPSEAQARQRFMDRYVVGTGIVNVSDPRLQAQLLDYSITSGPSVAISKVQEILKLRIDGIIGPQTLAVLATKDPRKTNNSLVIARVMMICRLVQAKPSQLQFLAGWCDRAMQFLF